MDTEVLKRYVVLDELQGTLEQLAALVKEEKGGMEDAVKEQLGMAGVQKITVDPGVTLQFTIKPKLPTSSKARKLVKPLVEGLKRDMLVSIDPRTLSLNGLLWAYAGDGGSGETCEALKANGLGEYVKENFNTQSISAYVREAIKTACGKAGDSMTLPKRIEAAVSNGTLPKAVAGALKIIEKFNISVRRA